MNWDLQWSQEKRKTMLVQNLGGQTKSIMVFSEVAYCLTSTLDYIVTQVRKTNREKGY